MGQAEVALTFDFSGILAQDMSVSLMNGGLLNRQGLQIQGFRWAAAMPRPPDCFPRVFCAFTGCVD